MRKLGILILSLFLLNTGVCWAGAQKDAVYTVEKARLVLDNMTRKADSSIPKNLLLNAQAVIIIPSLLKGGFIVGGAYGTGIMLSRLADGSLSAPAFITVGGASLGLQLGGESVELILIANTAKGLKGLLENSFTLGSNLSVALGPVGRDSGVRLADTDTQADLYSYSKSSGLFASVALEGMQLFFDQDLTTAYYGQPYSAHEILVQGKVNEMPETALQLLQTIQQYTK